MPALHHHHPDTDRVRKPTGALRRWIALLLLALSIGGAGWIFTRNIDWEDRHREEKNLGTTAERNGKYESARRHYEAALQNNPYDWETRLALARILNRHLHDDSEALRQYLTARAYTSEPAIDKSIANEIAILNLIRNGELEDPHDAVDDMFLAIENNAQDSFNRRLSNSLRSSFHEYWQSWSQRGRPEITYCKITGESAGFYDAVVELSFANGTVIRMHMYCPIRELWRVELSFP